MTAILSHDGKIAIPQEIRDSAQLKPGDKLHFQLYKGALLLRKQQPLSSGESALLLERSRSQPEPAAEDLEAVDNVIRTVRSRSDDRRS
ncbi:MAG TPA: AbrB/MazE/SpoVT family DNA-binding domain-containing protein [Verrucomicrobiae bacterium]|nr:AbrB/MazE/SpoVT family DNA-binding domain-containing protein [Verrucomicrobiae bacterium]